jgi:hypothetical protein
MDPVKIPEKYLKPRRQVASELRVGAEGAINGGHIYVDPNLSVYLSAEAPLEKSSLFTTRVKRESEGFVVWLSKHHYELFEPAPLPPKTEFLPVIRIEEDERHR